MGCRTLGAAGAKGHYGRPCNAKGGLLRSPGNRLKTLANFMGCRPTDTTGRVNARKSSGSKPNKPREGASANGW